MIQKMGSVRDLIEKIPGLSSMLPPGAAAQVNDSELTDAETIILSMTKFERQDPQSLIREPSRVRRIAGGSGRSEQSVGELVQKFLYMRQMMGSMGGGAGGGGGVFGGLPGMGGLARNVRRAMKGGKMPEGFPQMPGGMPGFPGMGMPGMGMPGMGMPGMSGARPPTPAMRALSASERNAKKNQRKRERDARKKGKKK